MFDPDAAGGGTVAASAGAAATVQERVLQAKPVAEDAAYAELSAMEIPRSRPASRTSAHSVKSAITRMELQSLQDLDRTGFSVCVRARVRGLVVT
jgi:hypothetical protein